VRVLVVEDEVSVATGVQRCLSADGFDVEVAHDGAAGLERVRDGHFDLIVLDLLLPSMNGYRVCESIRADGDWTPILMLTAKSGEYDEAEGLEIGADDFLRGPVTYGLDDRGARPRIDLNVPSGSRRRASLARGLMTP
jgi:DNA-binding response OmpR family regulator